MDDVDGGLVVYDERTDEAHYLAPNAAALWRACTGHSDADEVAAAAHVDSATAVEILRTLEARGLISAPEGQHSMTRRKALSRAGKIGLAAAVTAPVLSVVIPPAASAASNPDCDPRAPGGCVPPPFGGGGNS